MARLGCLSRQFSPAHPKVLLVEGEDEFYLLLELLKHMQLEMIDVRVYDGVTGLADTLTLLRNGAATGFDNVTTLGVWQDGDTDAAAASQRVRGALSSAGFGAPEGSGLFVEGAPRVGILILPDGTSDGALEDLCLASARDTSPLSCVCQYTECLQSAGVDLHPNLAKTKVHAFLASRKEPGLKIGQAAQAKHWDFDHDAWEPVRRFLLEM